jgi:DNA replication and repair protein RecF
VFLSSLTLRQFRSHESLTLSVEPGVNLFIGSNGAGKTNFIEALAMLATGASPRGAENESMVAWGKDGFAILGTFVFEDGRDPVTLEMRYKNGEARTVRENGQVPVRLKNLIGRVPMVSFVPEDLALVKGEPDLRRRAVNMVLLQVDPEYADALKKYAETLKSRNAALKQIFEGRLSPQDLDPWDAGLISSGLVLIRKRQQFVDEFSERLALVAERVSGARDVVALEYKPSIDGQGDDAAQRWQEKLRTIRSHEIGAGLTLSGPQRDDFLFLLDGRPAKSYASEGQMRTSAVAFKLAEIPYIQEKRGQKPICLLDDVLSELDHDRARHLLDELTRTGQCFVTLTGLEAWPKEAHLPVTVYRVDYTGINKDSGLSREVSTEMYGAVPALS